MLTRRNVLKDRGRDHMTNHSLPVLMGPSASVQAVARVASSVTEDVQIRRSAAKDVNQECHTVHGSQRIATLTMAPGYTTQDVTDQETRKEAITGEQNMLVIITEADNGGMLALDCMMMVLVILVMVACFYLIQHIKLQTFLTNVAVLS